ncbi:unannotated protein [freshwater metagenome]|uniref:Unannotated protein n=1 Tax=freshwater metagenome TaxID=449393 RepID=A0A6J7L6M8_9ZZZZ
MLGGRVAADRLRGVDEQRHVVGRADRGHLGEGLAGTDLVVRRLHRREGDAAASYDTLKFTEVDTPELVDARGDQFTLRHSPRRMEHAGMLDGRGDDAGADACPALGESGHPEVYGLGARARERDLVWAGPEHSSDRFAGHIE